MFTSTVLGLTNEVNTSSSVLPVQPASWFQSSLPLPILSNRRFVWFWFLYKISSEFFRNQIFSNNFSCPKALRKLGISEGWHNFLIYDKRSSLPPSPHPQPKRLTVCGSYWACRNLPTNTFKEFCRRRLIYFLALPIYLLLWRMYIWSNLLGYQIFRYFLNLPSG